MKTIVFVSRHSEPLRHWLSEYNADDNEQLRNEAETERQFGEFGETYRQENEQLRIEAENKRQDSVTGEAYRIANEQKREQTFNEKIEEYDQTIEDKISEYDEKVETVLADSNIVFVSDIANNLDTEEEGKVLDATQGKVLNDKFKSLYQRKFSNMV